MSDTILPEFLPLAPLTGALLGFCLGALLGLVHFASLHRVAALYSSGGPMGRALALQLGRFVLLVAGLSGLAFLGAVPLLSGALGLLVARGVILRRARAEE